MLGKAMVSIGMALVMAAIPAAAHADWTDGTNKVAAQSSVTLAGSLSFVGGIGGITCSEASGALELTPGTTADVTAFGAKNITATCKAGGPLVFCEVHVVEASGLNWTAHTNGSTIAVTGLNLNFTITGAFCPYHIISIKGEITLTPDNLHAATKVTPAGTVEALNGTTGAFIQNITAGGSLSVTPSGTYGIT